MVRPYVPGFDAAHRRGTRRRRILALLAGLSFALIAIDLLLTQGVGPRILFQQTRGLDRPPADPDASPPSIKSSGPAVRSRLAAAGRMLAAGDLRGARHEYLTTLLSLAPDSAQAWRGLVALHRRWAGRNPAALQRQADAYRLAIKNGTGMNEQYSPRALEVLAKAAALAAREVEITRRRLVAGAFRETPSEHADIVRSTRAALAASAETRWRPVVAYVIRVGEFTNPAMADRMMHFVRSKGYIVDVARHGRVSQVVTPPYRTRRQAEYVVRGLEGLGLPADLLARRLPSR